MRSFYAFVTLLLCSLQSTAQLSGTYTVGGASPDYVSVTDAVNALTSQGANNDVTFNIRPGIYSGNYDLLPIPGNPGYITFRSSTMNAADVVLEHMASGASDNHIFMVDSLAKVSFEQLTFKPLDFTYAKAILFRRDADQLRIDGCVFIGSMNDASSSWKERVLIHSDDQDVSTTPNTSPDDVLISNNVFHYGRSAMYIKFSPMSGFRARRLNIEGNRMYEQLESGIEVSNAFNSTIQGNLVSTDRSRWFVGIRTHQLADSVLVMNNIVQARSINDAIGIEFSNTQSSQTQNVLANNMVYVNGPGELWGIAVYNLWDTYIEHNTAVVQGGDPSTSYALYHLSNFADGEDTEFRNNVLTNYSGGPALRAKVTTNIGLEEYNALYTDGTDLVDWDGMFFGDLGGYQMGTAQGMGSVEMDPAFALLPDVHLNSCSLSGLGTPTSLIIDDVDGDPRSGSAPDMGADEFTFDNGTLTAVIDTVTSSQTPYTLTTAHGTSFLWSTGAITQSIDIVSSGTYSVSLTDVNGCSYSVDYPFHVIITTDVEEERDEAIRCWPVPTTDRLFVDLLKNNVPFSIIGMTGRVISNGRIQNGSIDLSELPAGTYLLDLGQEGKRRFVVQR